MWSLCGAYKELIWSLCGASKKEDGRLKTCASRRPWSVSDILARKEIEWGVDWSETGDSGQLDQTPYIWKKQVLMKRTNHIRSVIQWVSKPWCLATQSKLLNCMLTGAKTLKLLKDIITSLIWNAMQVHTKIQNSIFNAENSITLESEAKTTGIVVGTTCNTTVAEAKDEELVQSRPWFLRLFEKKN